MVGTIESSHGPNAKVSGWVRDHGRWVYRSGIKFLSRRRIVAQVLLIQNRGRTDERVDFLHRASLGLSVKCSHGQQQSNRQTL
jgi:hypothetical protein